MPNGMMPGDPRTDERRLTMLGQSDQNVAPFLAGAVQ